MQGPCQFGVPPGKRFFYFAPGGWILGMDLALTRVRARVHKNGNFIRVQLLSN